MDWTQAHSELCQALMNFRDAEGLEEEALSAVDDVYHESDEHYVSGGPKLEKKPS
jgi:hypothetical protein